MVPPKSPPSFQRNRRLSVGLGLAAAAGFGCNPLLSWALGASAAETKADRSASTWPNKPVRLIVPYAPGNISDSSLRVIAQHMSNALGQPFVVENKSGANTRIGTDFVAKAEPDGYTWLYTGPILAVMGALFDKLPFNPAKDLAATTMAITNPTIFLVRPDFPAKDMREFIALSQKEPKKYFVGSGGVGTMPHMAFELLVATAGLKAQHVPYRGGASWQSDFMGGQISGIFDNPTSALPLIQQGMAKALAVTSAQRIPTLPNVPTVAELGVLGFEVNNWFGFFAPAKTNQQIGERMSAEVGKVMRLPEVDAYFTKLGVTPVGGTPQQFTEVVSQDSRKWARIVKERSIKPD